MATRLGQPIDLGQTGLVQAASRRLSAPIGVAGSEEDERANGMFSTNMDPFSSLASQAVAPAPPPQTAQAPALKQFSFNPKYAQLGAGFERQIADAGLKRNNAKFQADDLYQTQLRDAEETQKTAMQRLRDTLAIRGLGNSTITINEQGNLQKNYQKYLDNLGRVRGNQIAGIESEYAGNLENVNRGREQLWFQQVAEEEELARIRAQEEAENARRAQEMELQRQWQQQQAEAQAAAYAQQQAAAQALAEQMASFQSASRIGVNAPGPGSYGGGGGGYEQKPYMLKDGTPVTEAQMMWQIANDPDQGWLNKLWDRDYHLPSHMRQAVLGRIAHNRGWGGGNLAAL